MFKRFTSKLQKATDREALSYDEMNLPNFFIVGANKAGTTSLYFYCTQHPNIFMSENKEPMFFLPSAPVTIEKEEAAVGRPYLYFTLPEYMSLFASANEPMRGEASTAYLANPTSTLWIKKIIPHAKLIAILRNPIERAISDYRYHQNGHVDHRTLTQAMNDALKDIPGQMADGEPIEGNPLIGRRYLILGLYGYQLSVVRQYFSDNQLFVADYEELNNDSVQFMQRVYKFLGVSNFVPPDTQRQNVSEMRKSLIDKDLENKMKEFFEEDIKLLQTQVDFDVMKWLQ